MNIAALLKKVAGTLSNKPAIIENGEERSYGELWDAIERLSGALHAIPIRENHRVALILPSGKQYIHCFFALLKINAIVSPLAPTLTSYELRAIFNNLNPHAIICTDKFVEEVLYDEPDLIAEKKLIVHGRTKPNIINKINDYHDLERLYSQNDGGAIEIATQESQVATINYTYTGLGYPLGAMLSHDNYLQGSAFYASRTRLTGQDAVLLVLPAHHVFSLMGGVIAPLLQGARIIITNTVSTRNILRLVERHAISQLLAVPSLYYLLLKYGDTQMYDISSLTTCIVGGDYMPSELLTTFQEQMGIAIVQGYGLTECLPVTCNPPSANALGSLGPPGRSDVKIKIVDDAGQEKREHEVGEIIVQSPTVMSGYYASEEETSNALEDGWLFTGDYGYLDSQGYLYFSGRKKRITKVGGNMVDLQEVCDVLRSHPLIAEASVSSRRHELWGHVLVATIVSTMNGRLEPDDIKAYLREKLSNHKIPKEIEITSGVVCS